MFNLTKLENGDLEITLDAADDSERQDLIEEIEELQTRKTDLDILLEGTESYWTNGSYQPFDAGEGNPFVGLTSAPCIAENVYVDDDSGKVEIEGDFWYFDLYMIESFIEELLREGRVVFTICKQE